MDLNTRHLCASTSTLNNKNWGEALYIQVNSSSSARSSSSQFEAVINLVSRLGMSGGMFILHDHITWPFLINIFSNYRVFIVYLFS